MSKVEFEQVDFKDKVLFYILLCCDDVGKFIIVFYYVVYKVELDKVVGLLCEVVKLVKDKGFVKYFMMCVDVLQSDDYQFSDFVWMDMKFNLVDIVIGLIEIYEDQLFGYKVSYESYVLVKDQVWSKCLVCFVKYLFELQCELLVDVKYKVEMLGFDVDFNVYFVVYYVGDVNVGVKIIVINLFNDEQVQLKKGMCWLQLENVMQVKFDIIMLLIVKQLIVEDQQKNFIFDVFFQNIMFYEVVYGLGIKNILDGKGIVCEVLKDQVFSFEEGKVDVFGLYMVVKLVDKGELDKIKLMDNYVIFFVGILCLVCFGVSDVYVKVNMVCFNFFQ